MLILIFLLAILFTSLLYMYTRLKKEYVASQNEVMRLESRLKALIKSEEEERMRLAGDLYDGLEQHLSAARFTISALQSFLKISNEGDILALKNAVDLLDAATREARSMSQNIIPNSLIRSGLVFALREFITKISTNGNLNVNLDIVGLVERLDQSKERVLFRIIEELMHNVIRHAQASEVSVQLVKHENELVVLIEDNGRGFDVELSLKNDDSIGLKKVQAWALFLNATVFFDSRLSKGTTVTIEVPM